MIYHKNVVKIDTDGFGSVYIILSHSFKEKKILKIFKSHS